MASSQWVCSAIWKCIKAKLVRGDLLVRGDRSDGGKPAQPNWDLTQSALQNSERTFHPESWAKPPVKCYFKLSFQVQFQSKKKKKKKKCIYSGATIRCTFKNAGILKISSCYLHRSPEDFLWAELVLHLSRLFCRNILRGRKILH